MKTVYNYDPQTFRYTGTGTAFESPLEEGVYHYPANSTTTAVPEYAAATSQAVWNGERWNIINLSAPVDSVEAEAPVWQQYQIRVLKALNQSNEAMTYILDAVILGTTELTNPQVVAYAKWRKQLKDILGIVDGDANVEIPVAPPLPAGVLPGAVYTPVLPKKG
jgi:hypothetical protein